MNIINIKKMKFFLLLSPVFLLYNGCACTTHKKELTARNEEIKTARHDLQLKEKTISDLLDRLSLKDQEIGKLTGELHTAQTTIEDLKKDIEQLREVDVQMEEKKKEVDSRIEETIPMSIEGPTVGTESATGTE